MALETVVSVVNNENEDDGVTEVSPFTGSSDATGASERNVSNLRSYANRLSSCFSCTKAPVERYFSPPKLPVEPFWTVATPTVDFKGRHELLTAIHTKLQTCSDSKKWQDRAVALVGFGGMGKSELARKFAAENREWYPSTAWIQAETEDNLTTSFRNLARLLKLPPAMSDDPREIARKVYDYVGKHTPSLFIYDNAGRLNSKDGNCGIFECLPHEVYEYPPLVLITSQSSAEWAEVGVKILQVMELSPAESVEFLQKSLGASQEDQRLNKSLQELSKRLFGYPLVLQLAAASIGHARNHKMPEGSLQTEVEKYTQELEREIESHLMNQTLPETGTNGYPRSVDAVWKITMRRLGTEKCAAQATLLMHTLAFCNPDRTEIKDLQRIYEDTKLLQPGITDVMVNGFESAMEKLKHLSLISEYDDGGWIRRIRPIPCVRMHRIVQSLSRQDDKDAEGLRLILESEKHFIILNYMVCEANLTIPSSVLRDDKLLDRWLLCFGYALRTCPGFPFKVPMRLVYNNEQFLEPENGSITTTTRDKMLAAEAFVRKLETENDRGKLYTASVDYAKKYRSSVLRHVAEYCAFKCWTSKPFSCNPFRYPLFAFLFIVILSLILSHFFVTFPSLLLYLWYELSTSYNCDKYIALHSSWDLALLFALLIVYTIFGLWTLRVTERYFWFRMVLGMKTVNAHKIRLLYEMVRAVAFIFIFCASVLLNVILITSAIPESYHYYIKYVNQCSQRNE